MGGTSFAVEGGGGREGVRTEVMESLEVALESGREVSMATEPPVHRYSEAVPQLELQ